MERVILHADCNCFFASVEMAGKPELKNVPMAVAGDAEKRHGIILAKNDIAKKYGIVTAEPIWKAKAKCKDLVIVEPHYDMYVKYSKAVNRIYQKYTDLIEPFGMDESWLDVTSSRRLFGTGEEIAKRLRAEVKQSLGITISVGVSFNKVFAKLGSDYKKPDATTVITRANFKDIVYPLKVSELLFCGKSSTKVLNDMGIFTIGDLANSNKEYIEKKLGKIGTTLYEYSNGNDTEPVSSIYDEKPLKSISHDITFEKDLVGEAEVKFGVSLISEEVGTRIRKLNKKALTVHVGIKDKNLKVVSKQITLKVPINLTSEIIKVSIELIKSFWDMNKAIRMISISLSNFVAEDYAAFEQLSIFETEDKGKSKVNEKQERLEKAVDLIRNMYGDSSVVRANLLESSLYSKDKFKIKDKTSYKKFN